MAREVAQYKVPNNSQKSTKVHIWYNRNRMKSVRKRKCITNESSAHGNVVSAGVL